MHILGMSPSTCDCRLKPTTHLLLSTGDSHSASSLQQLRSGRGRLIRDECLLPGPAAIRETGHRLEGRWFGKEGRVSSASPLVSSRLSLLRAEV